MKYTQQIRFNTSESNAFIGPEGVLTVDIEAKELRIHDGFTPGGHRVLNSTQLTTYASVEFNDVFNLSMTGDETLSGAHTGKLINLTAVGDVRTLTLPALSDFDVGERIVLRAASDDVRVKSNTGDGWIRGTTDASSFDEALPQGTLWTLAKMTSTRFIMLRERNP